MRRDYGCQYLSLAGEVSDSALMELCESLPQFLEKKKKKTETGVGRGWSREWRGKENCEILKNILIYVYIDGFN